MHRARQLRSLLRLQLGLTWGALGGLCGCQPELSAGEWMCAEAAVAPKPKPPTDVIQVPWSTGFEDRFCDYAEPTGFCYAAGNASYELVKEPVHSGRYAAAFNVNTEGGTVHQQARCVRQGSLPTAAYYGAWYYVPEVAMTDGKVWNLLHFQGRGVDPNERLHNLWDVSLRNGDNDDLHLVLHSPLARKTLLPEDPTPIPIGSWFHVEMFLRRASDETGEVALYQDGELLVEATDLLTDDSTYTQWYVGNYSDGMTPVSSILYVDDVSIRAQ